MTVLFALTSALVIGAADFIGGATSRRVSAIRLTASVQLVGLVLVVPVALAVGADRVTLTDAWWSVASGLVVGIGLALFYAAMARGLISVIAPITATVGAVVPVTYGLARGERPGPVALAGLVLAAGAIALVSISPDTGGLRGSGLGLGVGAGILFGLFYVFLSRPSEDAGLWPVVLSRVGSTVVLLVAALAVTRGLSPGRAVRLHVGVIAALEIVGATTLLFALQSGPVSIASVLSSLYPVTTTFLAAWVLHERLRRIQLVGVALALVAIVLISAG